MFGAAADAGIGAGLGGLLGQAFSAPRRFVWDSLGLPESGTELVGNLTGMDQESPWTKALGFGAEVLGDPLTYAGGAIGKIGGSLLGRAGGVAAKAAPEGASALEQSLLHLGEAAPGELGAIGDASFARELSGYGDLAAMTTSHPVADVEALGGVGLGLGKTANKYNANRSMMLDALQEYGAGHQAVNDLALQSDQLRTGLLKKAINQESVLSSRSLGRGRGELADAWAGMAPERQRSLLESGAGKIAGSGSRTTPQMSLQQFISSLDPYSEANTFGLPATPPSPYAEAPMVNFPGLNAVVRRP